MVTKDCRQSLAAHLAAAIMAIEVLPHDRA
jgi:hypothetical protein